MHSAIGFVSRDSGFASDPVFGVIALVGGWHSPIRVRFVVCFSQTNTNTNTNTDTDTDESEHQKMAFFWE